MIEKASPFSVFKGSVTRKERERTKEIGLKGKNAEESAARGNTTHNAPVHITGRSPIEGKSAVDRRFAGGGAEGPAEGTQLAIDQNRRSIGDRPPLRSPYISLASVLNSTYTPDIPKAPK